MLRVIRWVSEGRRHIPSEVASTIAEHLGQEELSPRESSVLRLIRDGYRNKQIAQMLRNLRNDGQFPYQEHRRQAPGK